MAGPKVYPVTALVVALLLIVPMSVFEPRRLYLVALCVAAGLAIRALRKWSAMLLVASLTVLLAGVTISLMHGRGSSARGGRFRRLPPVHAIRIETIYNADLTFIGDVLGSDGRRSTVWQLAEEMVVDHDPTAPNRETAEATELPPIQTRTVSRTADGKYRVELVGRQVFALKKWPAVTSVSVRWSSLRGRDGWLYVPRIVSGQIRVRTPQHLAAGFAPAPSAQSRITGGRAETVIPLRPRDTHLEIEVLHPFFRNPFAAWLRRFSLFEVPIWLGGIMIGALAAGIQSMLKAVVARLRRRRKAERPIGFDTSHRRRGRN